MAEQTLTFTGTIVSVETRFNTKITRAIPVGEPHADWVLTLDVERADEGAPAPAGARVSFLIHSPTHTLFESAEDAPGMRFDFTIQRDETPAGRRWSRLGGKKAATAAPGGGTDTP